MLKLLGASVLAASLSACGGSSGSGGAGPFKGTPACDKIVVGVTISEAEWRKGCMRDGNTFVPTLRRDCQDGRQLATGGGGWAFIGEPTQALVDGEVPSDVFWDECLG